MYRKLSRQILQLDDLCRNWIKSDCLFGTDRESTTDLSECSSDNVSFIKETVSVVTSHGGFVSGRIIVAGFRSMIMKKPLDHFDLTHFFYFTDSGYKLIRSAICYPTVPNTAAFIAVCSFRMFPAICKKLFTSEEMNGLVEFFEQTLDCDGKQVARGTWCTMYCFDNYVKVPIPVVFHIIHRKNPFDSADELFHEFSFVSATPSSTIGYDGTRYLFSPSVLVRLRDEKQSCTQTVQFNGDHIARSPLRLFTSFDSRFYSPVGDIDHYNHKHLILLMFLWNLSVNILDGLEVSTLIGQFADAAAQIGAVKFQVGERIPDHIKNHYKDKCDVKMVGFEGTNMFIPIAKTLFDLLCPDDTNIVTT